MMIVGGVTLAALAWPLMKWTVALMGGVYGALLARVSGAHSDSRLNSAGPEHSPA